MGNSAGKMCENSASMNPCQSSSSKYEPVETFQFHDSFPEETTNGLYFNDIYIPEELVLTILSYINPKEILKSTLVCKKWCNIIKSNLFWGIIYTRTYKKKAKKLPWYVYYSLFTTNYFNTNLLKNGNGQNKYDHWKIVLNYADGFKIENPPVGTDPLPVDVPDFNGKTSCFVTSYGECNKLQEISLENNRLIQLILNQFMPHIYLSEWVASRFDCGTNYILWCKLLLKKLVEKPKNVKSTSRFKKFSELCYSESSSGEDESVESLHIAKTGRIMEPGTTWSKVELVVKEYPCGVKSIIFQHQGVDTQFWKGHYGSKMAGGVLKILFDSIEPDF